jgi:hypothetical protein
MSAVWGPVAWMTAAGAAAWGIATVVAGSPVNPEVLLGLIGPLAGADIRWFLMARASASGGEQLMKTMVRLLGLKMVLFGMYAVVVLRVMDVRPVLFVGSFAGFFVMLHALEAMFLRRLIVQSVHPPQS